MNLHKLFLVNNDCYKAGVVITPKGILVHSTGANNPWLKRYVGPDDGELGFNENNNHWNTAKPGGKQICVHAFIGKLANGDIATYQTLPWKYKGWHSGSGSKGYNSNANNTGYIGFEICEDNLSDATYFNKVYREAVELCAYLCKTYNIKPEKPYLICHSEGCELGIASNHGDVMHWFPKHKKSMDTFRADVSALLESQNSTTSSSDELYRIRKTWADAKSQIGAYKNLTNAKKACQPGYSVFNSIGEIVYTNKLSGTVATYEVHTRLAGYFNAADANHRRNRRTTLSPGTYYIYKKYPKGYNGMYNITTNPTASTPGFWINPADNKIQATQNSSYNPKVGDKIKVNGIVASNGMGGGNKVTFTNKTMYVKEILSSSIYTHYIGISLTPTSSRYGWVELASIKKI